MTKFRTVLITAIIALPLGAIAGGALRGHPNLERARNSLNDADRYIEASQRANEGVWKDEGGHGPRAKELIGQAKEQLDRAAEWINHH